MPTDAELAALRAALRAVDWTYQFADTFGEWERGRVRMDNLTALWKRLGAASDERGQEAMRDLWLRHAPSAHGPPPFEVVHTWGKPGAGEAKRSDGMRTLRKGYQHWVLVRPDGRPVENRRGPIRFRSAYDAIAYTTKEGI